MELKEQIQVLRELYRDYIDIDHFDKGDVVEVKPRFVQYRYPHFKDVPMVVIEVWLSSDVQTKKVKVAFLRNLSGSKPTLSNDILESNYLQHWDK